MIQTQEQTERKPFGEERGLRLETKTTQMIGQSKADQLRQDGQQVQSNPHREEMSRMVIVKNNIINQINHDEKSQEQDYINRCFHIGGMGEKEVDKQQKVSEDKKQMQGSSNEDLLNGNEGKIVLKRSKSSVCSICKRRRPNHRWHKKFTYEELQAATDGFSIKNTLSEGEYGSAFRGQLDNELKIVVKQHQITSFQAEKLFISEVELLTNARHENLIMVLGSCIRESQLLIVYEHACNGSLDQHLSSKNKYVNVTFVRNYF